jgi:hypothetical protein
MTRVEMIDEASRALMENPIEYAKMELSLIAMDHIEVKSRLSHLEKEIADFRIEYRETTNQNNEWLRQVMLALDSHMDREEMALSRQATETAYQLRELALMDHGDIHNEIKTLNEKVETITNRQQRIVKLNHTFIWASVIIGSATVFGAVTKFLLNIW